MFNLRSPSQRAKHARETVRLLDRLESRYRGRIHSALSRLYRAHVEGRGTDAIHLAQRRLAAELFSASSGAAEMFRDRWSTVVKSAVIEEIETKEARPRQPKKNVAELQRISETLLKLEQRARRISEALSEAAATKVKKTLARAASDALGERETARMLEQEGVTWSRSRAMTVARTEIHGSAMGAELDSVRADSESANLTMTKEWLATNDDRTREDHAHADGQIVDLDAPFKVGDAELMAPGDPDGPPEQVINCRCVLAYAPK